MRRVAKGAGGNVMSHASVYLGANILNSAIPFFLLPVLTRLLTPAQYGVVAVFEATVACLGVFAGLSVHGAVGVHYFTADRSTFPQYVGACIQVLIGSTLVTGAALVAGATTMADLTGLSVHWLLVALAVSFAQFLVIVRLAIWQSRNEALRYGAFQILQTAANAAISLFLVVGLAWGSSGRMAGFSIAVIAFGLVALMSMQAGGWIVWKWNREYVRDALCFGLPLVPHTLGTLAVASVDRFIITNSLGADATGVYFAAAQLSMPLLMLGSSFNRAFVPWLFGKLSKNENAQAVLMSYAAIAGFFLSAALYAASLYFSLSLIVGERYVHARPIALILIVGTSFQAAYYAVVNYIFYAKRTGYLAMITFATGALYVAGAFVVVPNYGLLGMATLFASVQCLTFFLVWLISGRISPQPWLDLSSMRVALRTWRADVPRIP